MPNLSDFLPPILARLMPANRKDMMGGEVQFLPGMAEFLNPAEPVYKTARDYQRMVEHGYQANVYLFRAVSIISQSIAGIPWHLYRKASGSGGKNARKDLGEHPAIQLLNVAANDEESGPEFLEALIGYWLLAGSAYVWAVRPETGATRPPTKLFAVQPNLMRPDLAKDGTLLGWVYQVGSHKQEFAVEDVLRVRDFHPLSRALGLAPAQVAARPLDQHNAANDWNTALLQNMARPSGMLTPKDSTVIPADAHETLKNDLRERYQSPKNAGRPLVPRAPMVWQQMGTTPTEMDWLAGKTQAAREIAIALGVPSELLGDAANKTYSNTQTARLALYTETILPRMDRLKASLTRWLLPMYGLDSAQYELDYDRADIEALQEDTDARHDRAAKGYAGGVLSLNEARELIGADAIDEGDVFLAPPRAMTLDQLLEGAGLPAMPDGGSPHAPPTLPHAPPAPPALPPARIVEADPSAPTEPPEPGSTEGKGLAPPFAPAPHAMYSVSARRARLARAAARAKEPTRAT